MSVRKLASGRWQYEVYDPSSKRHYGTHDTKTLAKTEEAKLIARFAVGDTRDPRAGNITVGAWYERVHAVSGGEPGTRKRTESFWETRVGPKWAHWPLAAITRLEVKAWVAELTAEISPATGRPLAADTVAKIVQVMSTLYREALDQSPPLVAVNPFARLGKKVMPKIPPAPIYWYEDDEIDALLRAIPRQSDRVLVELGFWVGLRPGELFGLFGDRVRWMRDTIEVTRVETRTGLREYPKSAMSHRTVPVPPDQMAGLREIITGCDPHADRIFLTPQGKPINDSNFRQRVWKPAIERAGLHYYDPRVMRHTAATNLVMAGVDLKRVQELLGHERYSTTERYAHLQPSAHEAIREAWANRPQRRTG